MEQSDKLFILIDRRLSRSQQAVQAAHAAIEFALKYGNEGWKHESLVLLGVDGGDELDKVWFQDKLFGCDRVAFHEPYYDDRMTAVACYGCDNIVKELRLL